LVAPLSSVTSSRSGSVDGDLEPQRECETMDWDWRGMRISGEDGAESGGQPLLADVFAKVCNPSRCPEKMQQLTSNFSFHFRNSRRLSVSV
jgi:hypothetical protein